MLVAVESEDSALLEVVERPLVAVESEAVAVLRDLNAVPSISASIVLSEALIKLTCVIVVLREESVEATDVVKVGLTSLATVLICA
jgi:hypothetical protein